MQSHLLFQFVHSLNITPECLHDIFHITNDEFETWFNQNTPLSLHAQPSFHFRQVQSMTTVTPTTPTAFNTPASSQ